MQVKRGSTLTTCTYQAGLRNGNCHHHKKGRLSKTEVYANGLRSSEIRYFRGGKQIKQLTNYDPNTRKKHGAYAEYDRQGVLRMQGKYAAGKRTGRWVLRSNEKSLTQADRL